MTIYVAGTFNRLHEGHKALLARCMALANNGATPQNIDVSITSDEYLRNKYPRAKPEHLESWHTRKTAVQGFLGMAVPLHRIHFSSQDTGDAFPNQAFGTDILVVSEESAGRAAHLIAKHHSDILMSVVPIVRNKEGYKISSRDMLPVEETYRTFEDMVRDLGECVIHDPTYGYYQYHYKGKKYTWNDLCPEYNPKSEEDGEPI